MDYLRAVKFIFERDKWWQLALAGTICMLVPIVGMIVFFGYLAEMIERFHETREDSYQDFDADRLGEYLKRGLWPFLGMFILGMVLAPALVALMFLPMIAAAIFGVPEAAILFFLLSFVLYFLLIVGASLAGVPVLLGGALGQSLGAALSWTFVRDFMTRVWLEIVISVLFLLAVSVAASLAGMVLCGVGIYPAMALVTVCQWHLYWQLYEVYLERGGTPPAA